MLYAKKEAAVQSMAASVVRSQEEHRISGRAVAVARLA